jgi:cation:H+ antiporter
MPSGGIAVQTLWLVIADLTHRRANLEHAAAAPENILQGNLLIALLCLPLLAMTTQEITLGGFLHPVSILMVLAWIAGMRMVRTVHTSPMWRPQQTSDTVEDVADESASGHSLKSLWMQFVVLTAILGIAGYLLAQSASTLTERTPLSQSVMGGIFTSAASSLPELIVVLAAVRRGAHTLAVSNIIGGNALDTLFLLFADLGYRKGSIYHAVARDQQFFMLLTVLMTAVLMMGLIRRERHGFLRIGFESTTVIVLYGTALTALIALNG